MKRLAEKMFKTYEEECGKFAENINTDIPKYKEIEDHKEAKKVMEEYLQGEITKVEDIINPEKQPATQRVIDNAKEILKDPKFICETAL